MDAWVQQELNAGVYPDRRLQSRLGQLLGDLGRRFGDTIPLATQDWAGAKAAYRFLSNPRVDEECILSGHLAATRARFDARPGTVLVLHDTTEFSFQRRDPAGFGRLKLIKGRHATHTVCGILMHSSLVVTTDGLPLGLAAVKFWTRKKFKGTNALRGKVNATRLPIEQKESVRWVENVSHATEELGDSSRCVHVGDREADIYELFCAAHDARTHFLIRTCVDRFAGRGDTTVSARMAREPVRGEHAVEVRDDHGRVSTATLRVRFCRMTVHPPVAKRKRYPSLSLTVLHADEPGAPAGRDAIHWQLLTDLPVDDLASAVEKLDWYAMRWKIETFHKVLKSGGRAEESRLRTAERLTNLLAVLCVVGWRVFWLTMLNRAAPDEPAETAFTPAEVGVLDRLTGRSPTRRTVAHYVLAVAKLGGYLARAKDPPPGNEVIWRGLSRLADISLGAELMDQSCG
ncbi:IS4 family transposase [Gemmata sp. G18]|uniref:IS4 family transposase n=1 Tax=Gemmata palustris TaxID=2822762 RepID=A0ABS5BVT0_9BACT|nr:IS4 family transposase [Gemmata palustris]MBP3957832.1 IS4 family transposase [Gemmata palustris]